MKKSNVLFHLLVGIALLFPVFASAQDVPSEVSSIISMKLEDGEDKLQNLGYSICGSSFLAKKQDWYNPKENICITLKFDKKTEVITEVDINPATSECQRKLEESNKVWEKYHDGQAPASSPKLDEERKKLADKGFKASFWADQLSPGRSIEYWINESEKKAMYIVWEVPSNKWAKTDKADYESGINPAPKNN
ncbi:hypothetical protein JYB64_17145 [Algoriphagus aestuarii]|nr:hypothetical protein [Algoriphagus aestuarii]